MLKIMNGDALEMLRTLPDESVNCCVTSPPYYGLRDYGAAGQIGLEFTPEQYIERLVAVFREVRRVLHSDGTCWINIGDSYWGGKGQSSQAWSTEHQERNTLEKSQHQITGKGETRPTDRKHAEIKSKDLIGIPWMLAFALRADGWYLRQDIVWAKPNPMPESVRDRCTKSHEYIFLLTKSARYWYDAESIKEPVADSTIGRGPVDFGGSKGREYKKKIEIKDPNYRNGSEQWGRTFDYTESCKNGCNKRSVWSITTKPYSEAHFATFPPELPRICIMAGCPQGGTVLDPFAGSGTTGKVALELGRKAILIEMNPAYINLIMQRTKTTIGMAI